MTEKLLEEFQPYVDTWTLVPSDGGRFEVEVNGTLIHSKLATHQHAEFDTIRDELHRLLNFTS